MKRKWGRGGERPSSNPSLHRRANMARIRHSRPDSGLDFQVTAPNVSSVCLFARKRPPNVFLRCFLLRRETLGGAETPLCHPGHPTRGCIPSETVLRNPEPCSRNLPSVQAPMITLTPKSAGCSSVRSRTCTPPPRFAPHPPMITLTHQPTHDNIGPPSFDRTPSTHPVTKPTNHRQLSRARHASSAHQS